MFPPIYVIHCKKGLENRKLSIERQMSQYQLPFEFILDHDHDEINDATSKQYFEQGYPPKLMSVCLKHRLATEKFIRSGAERALIFEDDILFLRNFSEGLAQILEESKSILDDHVVYLSNYGNRYTPRSRLKKGRWLYENNHSRACDSYLLSRGAALKRIAWWDKNKYSLSIDHQFNVIDAETSIRIFWAEDPIIEQGSENGTFNSCIDSKYGKWKKKIRWNLDKLYKKHILRNLR